MAYTTHDPSTINNHPASAPWLPPARPLACTSVAPGSPPHPGPPRDPEPTPGRPHEARWRGSVRRQPRLRTPPSPFSMLAHARHIGGWRVEVQGHVTALWGRACPRRGVGVSGGTCTMAFDGRGSVACSFPRHLSWKQHVCVGGRLPVQHGVPTVNPNLLVTSVHD